MEHTCDQLPKNFIIKFHELYKSFIGINRNSNLIILYDLSYCPYCGKKLAE